MASRKGKCTNFGNCDIADTRQITQVPEGSELVCSTCGHSLTEIRGERAGSTIKPAYLALAGLGVVVIVFAAWWLFVRAPASASAGGSLGRPLRVGIVTWPGYAGGIVANNGFKPNKDCIYWNKHNLQVEFLLMEDTDVRAKAFAKGGENGVDIVWSTVDFWANELPGFVKDGIKARAIMQVDWSRGGDAIVADRSIKRIEDLKGKRISLALFTPSHWLLESSLKNSSLDDSEQAEIVKNLVGKNASPDARADFVANKVDAAVVWEPDVTEALQNRPDAHVLISSRDADRLIADLMVAREDFIKEHQEVIKAFVEGWLDGTAEANRNPGQVAKLLMDNEPVYKELGEEKTRAGLPTVKWADLTDNTEMFGLDGKDALFDRIFQDASQSWIKRGYITQPVAPDLAKDITFLKGLYTAGPVQRPTGPIFNPASETVATKIAVSDKPINIFFATGSSALDTNAQQLLEKETGTLTQTFSNTYIRIEGNTDNLGSEGSNQQLSEQRAQAVVDFLVRRYNLNRNRFIAVGNGSKKPRESNVTSEGRAANRRTDIQVVTKS